MASTSVFTPRATFPFVLLLAGACGCTGVLGAPRSDGGSVERSDAGSLSRADGSRGDADVDPGTDADVPGIDAAWEEGIDAAVPGVDAYVEPVDAWVPPTPMVDAATPPTPPTPCAWRGMRFRTRHLQASMQHTDTDEQMRAAITLAFSTDADTISWTEIETGVQVRAIQSRAAWTTFWPSGSPEVVARNAVPISIRNSVFDFVRGNAWQASEGMAGVSPSRWVARVWIRHRATGLVQSRVSHHSVSGVDGDGEAPVAWRRMMHERDIAEFDRVMRLDDIPVIGSADFTTVRLRSHLGGDFRYDVPDSGGSHGDRLIDWVVRRPNPELDFISASFVDHGSADHRGVRAVYDYVPRCP